MSNDAPTAPSPAPTTGPAQPATPAAAPPPSPAPSDPTVDALASLGHITITIRAELDRTTLPFSDVAELEAGSVVRLPSSAGETISLYVGDVRIGFAEVLVVDGALAARVSELVDPTVRAAMRPGRR